MAVGEVISTESEEVVARVWEVRPGKKQRRFVLAAVEVKTAQGGGMPFANLTFNLAPGSDEKIKSALFHPLWLSAEGKDGKPPGYKLPDGLVALAKALGNHCAPTVMEYVVPVREKGVILTNPDGTPQMTTRLGLNSEQVQEYLEKQVGQELDIIERVGKQVNPDGTKTDKNVVEAFVPRGGSAKSSGRRRE